METKIDENDKPILIFDGDCGFCAYWAHYWSKLTGDRVTYMAYQEVAEHYPDISTAEFQQAIKYIFPDGNVASAAKASFLTLSHAPGKDYWLKLYKKVPPFAAVSEWSYGFIAKRRSLFHRASLFLWGRDYEPPRFELTSWLFLRLFGLIFLAAFVSFAVQSMALIGSHGVLPVADFTAALENKLGDGRYWRVPMVFWFGASDFAIHLVCWGGAAFSLLLVAGVLPRLSLIVLYILYLSLFYAGQRFMTFQWDLLLLEVGFLALILTLAVKPGIWLLRWLIFRFMLASGLVKIKSGDASWLDLSALSYHFETQPLPSPLAWYAHYLPSEILAFGTGATLFIELCIVFLVFFPRYLRFAAAFSFLLLQTVIALTGNYNFFNLLSIVLCLPLFDDAAIRKAIPQGAVDWFHRHVKKAEPRKIVTCVVAFVALWSVLASVVQFHNRFLRDSKLPAAVQAINNSIAPLRIVGTYGPFSVMTKKRPEIIIEGSDDRTNWREYTFKYKPGDVKKGTSWNIPHQPRIDWQLWFAALGNPQRNPWFVRFLAKILQGRPEVTAVFEHNPFPDRPPRYVRALRYDYHFASPEKRATENLYWRRELTGSYYPIARLKSSNTGRR